MRGTTIGACAAVAAIAFGAAGCGGSDESSTDSTAATITKEEFVTQANQICADGNKTIDAAANDVFTGGKPTQPEIEQLVTDTVIPSVQSQVDGIRALGIPAGDEDQVNALLDAVDSALAEAEQDPASLATNTDPFAEANKLADDYGLTECSG